MYANSENFTSLDLGKGRNGRDCNNMNICKNMSIACTLRRAIDIFMQKDRRLWWFVGYLP